MRQGMRLPSPALAVSVLALFVALGGTVYAAKKVKINGKAIKVKSLPGNRIEVGSVPANRLKPGILARRLEPVWADHRGRNRRAQPRPGAERRPRRNRR